MLKTDRISVLRGDNQKLSIFASNDLIRPVTWIQQETIFSCISAYTEGCEGRKTIWWTTFLLTREPTHSVHFKLKTIIFSPTRKTVRYMYVCEEMVSHPKVFIICNIHALAHLFVVEIMDTRKGFSLSFSNVVIDSISLKNDTIKEQCHKEQGPGKGHYIKTV